MRKFKRWRYSCDFCKKTGGQKPSMGKHEQSCTLNPDRRCNMCHYVDVIQAGKEDLVELFTKYSKKDHGELLEELRSITGDCPMCILHAIRIYGDPSFRYDFDFQKEVSGFWKQYNEDNFVGPY